MKKIGFWLGLVMAGLMSASAQVSVEVVQDQDQFLSGEAILTAVRITNHSGQALELGTDDDWLNFSLETRGTGVVARRGDVPVLGAFTLESSKVATKWVNLTPYFAVGRPGRYSITATVRVKGWNRAFTSQPKKFDIVDGAKLWEQEVGVPGSGGATNAPEVRKYILQEANYLRTQLRLYLSITDASGARVYTVFSIGPMVSFGRPEPQVDKFSNLHLLFQERAHSFDYFVFNPQGGELVHEIYDYVDTRPRLQPDYDGKIIVKGGVLRQKPSEATAPPPPTETNAPTPAKGQKKK